MSASSFSAIPLNKYDRLVFHGVAYLSGCASDEFIQRFPIGDKTEIGNLPAPRPMPNVYVDGPLAMCD